VANPDQTRAQLHALADYFEQRRNAILAGWRRAIDRDPELNTAARSTRNQFVDHIPDVLDTLASRLRADDPIEEAEARTEQKAWAAQHGMHRWQQGYQLTETMREWGHLHLCLLAELDRYCWQNPGIESEVAAMARRELARLASDGVCASAARYTQLQQSEAASRLYDLQNALRELKALENERLEAWRQAAHDLRGSAHVIANASAALTCDDVPDAKRTQMSATLSAAAASLNKLLTDLLDHARLEAGHEVRNLTHFDAAQLIRDFCDTTRQLAADRSLFLKCEGPTVLEVQGDPAKTQRILQNLVLNALKATHFGGVRVTWSASEDPRQANQWALCVQDTGPGLAAQPTPILEELKNATETARDAEDSAPSKDASSLHADPAPTLTSRSIARSTSLPAGEGIGLSIVKRLCELLDASIELESAPGQGTTFRVIFPRSYGDNGGTAG
jgi:signal transduction histidine kinase